MSAMAAVSRALRQPRQKIGTTRNEHGQEQYSNSNADEALMAHQSAMSIMLPGPFVVLQGMPGDGIANTIDTMPVVNYHGMLNATGEVRRRVDEDDTSATSEEEEERIGNPRQNSSNDGNSNEDDRPFPNEISSSSLITAAEENSSDGGYHHVSNSSSSHEAGDSINDESDVLFFDSTSSSSSVAEVVTAAPRTDRDQSAMPSLSSPPGRPTSMPVAAATSTEAPGGLHLPIPPSAVAGMGYNSILPPISAVAQRPQNTIIGTTPRRSGASSQHPVEDSFVVVQNNENQLTHHAGATEPGVSSLGSRSNTSSSNNTSIQHSNPNYANLSRQEKRAVRRWKEECREREQRQRNEMLMHANPQSGAEINSSSTAANLSRQVNQRQWWRQRKSGFLVVYDSLPYLAANNDNDHDQVHVRTGEIVGEVAPGCTVMGMDIVTLDSRTFKALSSQRNNDENLSDQNERKYAGRGTYQFLRIESPFAGYLLFSMDGYTYLGPGLPSYYTEPQVWTWRVTCSDGAFVRQGLELTSRHVDTIPYGAFLRVTRKTVNSMGLARLRVEATITDADDKRKENSVTRRFVSSLNSLDSSAATSSTSSLSHETNSNSRAVVGWVSEALNPLSGQRGPVVQPVPFPIPCLYRVTLPEGAVIRSDVELSSSQIGHAPLGSVLTISGRAYSEHPMDQCIERLKLAGGGGWISVRLNRPPPLDELVVEMVGIDGGFDPNEAGLYHLEKQRQVMQEYDLNSNSPDNSNSSRRSSQGAARSFRRLNVSGDISSINDEEDEDATPDHDAGGLGNSGELSGTCSSITSSAAMPALYRSGVAGGSVGSRRSGGKEGNLQAEERCLICLTEERTATMVHGETGHIACCLTCARILKARGDRCPVCRLPIDSVIQQFWA